MPARNPEDLEGAGVKRGDIGGVTIEMALAGRQAAREGRMVDFEEWLAGLPSRDGEERLFRGLPDGEPKLGRRGDAIRGAGAAGECNDEVGA